MWKSGTIGSVCVQPVLRWFRHGTCEVSPLSYYSPIDAFVFLEVAFLRVSTPKPRMIFLIPHTFCMPRPFHTFLFVHRNNIWPECKSGSSSLCNFLQCSVTSALLGPDTSLSTLLSTSLSLCCSLDVRDKIHTHTKQQAKLQLWIQTLPDFDTVAFWRPDRQFTCIGCPLVNQ